MAASKDDEWTIIPTTVAAVEAKYPASGERPVLGSLNDEWEALKAQMKEGDELYFFSSPAHYWRNLAGSYGIGLSRDGTQIASVIIIVS